MDLNEWLENNGLGKYARSFAENEIDFDVLPTLSQEDLGKLGLTIGARRRFSQALDSAKAESPSEVHPREVEQRFEECQRRLKEARAQQAATREILRIISSSPGELQPVLDAVAESAARFCGSNNALLFRLQEDKLYPVANHGDIPVVPGVPLELDTTTAGGACVVNRTTVHIADLLEASDEYRGSKQWGLKHGNRAIISTPMLRQGVAIGAITLRRREPGFFDDRQVELLKTFADQAVIAIENIRLFTELESRNADLARALDRMTATSAILRQISESQTDAQPVFETIVEHAAALVPESVVALSVLQNGSVDFKAFSGDRRDDGQGVLSAFHRAPDGSTATSRAILEHKMISIERISSEKGYALGEAATAADFRSAFAVPILREGRALGAIGVMRRREGSLDAHQVDMIKTFANQAAIAVEASRLFSELEARNRDLSESLEQQMATSEILRVTSSSQRDVQPVLDAIARNARRLCHGRHAGVFILDGDLIHCRALDGADKKGLDIIEKTWPLPLGRAGAAPRAVETGETVYIPDIESDVEYKLTDIAKTLGYRSTVATPMLRDGKAMGAILVTAAEPDIFKERQIEMLQTFADQAVIALENTRLFNELEVRNRDLADALEQQTATTEILRVTTESQRDVAPVFEAIARNARHLCRGLHSAVFILEGQLIHCRAILGVEAERVKLIEKNWPMPPGRTGVAPRAIETGKTVYVADVEADAEYEFTDIAETFGYRCIVAVPMLRDSGAMGAIVVSSAEPDSFKERQITILQTFADQAVIAIENTRLFNELESRNGDLADALEQQTATSKILQVISQSQQDVQPVFDSISESAAKLCGGFGAWVATYDGEIADVVANSMAPETVKVVSEMYPMRPDIGSGTGRALVTGMTVSIPDVSADADYRIQGVAKLGGWRAVLSVPMLRNDKPIGAISVGGYEPGMFTDRHADMLQTFAKQAVIAIENTRLFNETKEALEQQTATSEVLRAISNEPGNLQSVLDAVAANTGRLCDANDVVIVQTEGDTCHRSAYYAEDTEVVEFSSIDRVPLRRDFVLSRAIIDREPIHVPDVLAESDEEYAGGKEYARKLNYRTNLAVPLMSKGTAIGAIAMRRHEVKPFLEKQIDLVHAFADQAVIAIENSKLFNELQSRTQELARSVEQMRSLAEVGQAVNSTLDLQQVLSTIVRNAVALSSTKAGAIFEMDDDEGGFHLQATYGFSEEFVNLIRKTPMLPGEGATGRAAKLKEAVQIPDLTADPEYKGPLRKLMDKAGLRSHLAVPLLRDDRVLGSLIVSRDEPGEFPSEMVSLLQTFAAQSSLAVQNARLFREIAQKSRELEIASEHKSQFLANMSHELRTPLNAILGYTELIGDGIYGDVPEKIGEVMARVQAGGKHLLGLINDVLDLSKIEAGQLKLTVDAYSFDDAVQSVHSSLAPLAAEKGIGLLADVPTDLPIGHGDQRRIAQVLMNLVGNAIKFTDAGEVMTSVVASDSMFTVAVRDTGPGIPQEQHELVFGEFQQADNSSTREKGGSGLGLAIAKRFVELHGGRIWVDSTPGVGSTFSFCIPVNVEAQESEA